MSATPAPADPSSLTPLSPSKAVDLWWVKIPGRLRHYSFLLWAAWSDGIYLTAWPRLAVVLPVVVLVFGIVEGVTHWSVYSIGDSRVLGTAVHAVTFAQMLPLLVLAVVVGSLSANLGLMLGPSLVVAVRSAYRRVFADNK